MEPYDIKVMLTNNGFWYTYWYLTDAPKGYRYRKKYALWLMWVAYCAEWPDGAP
jgi:hypothetical protein